MSRLSFFLKFYQTCKLKFFILVLIFAFAGSILSCSLLVQRNNKVYGKAQIENIVGENLIEGDEEQEEYDLLFGTMEKVMTLFSLGSILIVVWGCTSILFFQNISMEKSHAMLRIFGMQKKDIFVKALVEGLGFGLLEIVWDRCLYVQVERNAPGVSGGSFRTCYYCFFCKLDIRAVYL